MRLVLADTSFVFALFGQDAHTAAARAFVARFPHPIAVTEFQRYEFANAVRFACFRKLISNQDADSILVAFESDIRTGFVQLVPCEPDEVLHEARRLSALYTISGGHRSFDILHVATARIIRAGEFLSFDTNQRKLAKAVGLVSGP
jgi:predicted nucleic acid-binding protein